MLGLNATKSESTFFSTWTHEATFKPDILIDNKVITFNKTPKLLGVIYDRTLSFHTHTEEISHTVSTKLGILASVSNSQWGWDKYHIGQLYFAYMRSKMDYSGAGWQPWLSETSIGVLERTQNKALRMMTGQLKSSPVEALRLESGIPSYETHMRRNILKSREKAQRLPEDHPRYIALKSAVPPRNTRQSWARKGKELECLLPPRHQTAKRSKSPASPRGNHASNCTSSPTLRVLQTRRMTSHQSVPLRKRQLRNGTQT